MHIFYLIASLFLVINVLLWAYYKKLNISELIIGGVLTFIVAGIFHFIAFFSMTSDIQTLSGKVDHIIFHPYWYAEWQEMETYTTSNSKGQMQTHTRMVTKSKHHYEYWEAICDFGKFDESFEITKNIYNQLSILLGNQEVKKKGYRPHYDSGDIYDYYVMNKTGYIQPVTTIKKFENRLKNNKTLFNYIEVPPSIKVFSYPKNNNFMISSRLIGDAKKKIDILEFDRMNTRLGPKKKVNVILVGFPKNSDSMMGKYQQAKWLCGKKNDLVICYGLDDEDKVAWSFSFGWTEKEIVKRNLETIFMENKIDNSILPLIEREINKNYIIKDWSKFSYVTINPPTWCIICMLITIIIVMVIFWYWAFTNDWDGWGIE